jgi:hypothetical protein
MSIKLRAIDPYDRPLSPGRGMHPRDFLYALWNNPSIDEVEIPKHKIPGYMDLEDNIAKISPQTKVTRY